MEEVAELRDAEGDAAAQGGVARLRQHLVVLEADRRVWLEVAVDVEDVGALEVDERGRDVGLAGTLARAHDVLDALLEELGRHNEAVAFAVVGDELEDSASGHDVLVLY